MVAKKKKEKKINKKIDKKRAGNKYMMWEKGKKKERKTL